MTKYANDPDNPEWVKAETVVPWHERQQLPRKKRIQPGEMGYIDQMYEDVGESIFRLSEGEDE